jgi:short-subunit dehydrogenase
MFMGEFTGKTVVITGASEGMGRALALKMAPERPRLVLAARNAERLAAIAAACRQAGAETVTLAVDLAQRADCEKVVATAVAAFGGVDVLVNNAGITLWADFAAMTDPELIRKVLEINYLSVAYTTYFALPHLLRSKGRLAATSSVAGIIGVPGHAAYGASKHAIHGLLDSLRLELRGTGVSVTIVCPDFVMTELHDRGLNAAGEPMRRRLNPTQAISAEAAAAMMYDAIRRRRRIMIMSARGRWALSLRNLWPALLDYLASRSARRQGLH